MADKNSMKLTVRVQDVIHIELTIEEARKIRQDLGDLDPARMNVETVSLRNHLAVLLS